MREFPFLSSAPVYIEIGPTRLKALSGEDGLDVPLERLANGRLTEPCKARLTLDLQRLLQHRSWQTRGRAFCAIGARGVSVRRLTLPAVGKEELQRLLLLQIESEFPLPPDELAWGYRRLSEENPPPHAAAQQELLVVAVRKEVVEEYAGILAACGLTPVFTLAALARGRLVPQPSRPFALLEVGRSHTELALFENGLPTSIRILPWGDDSITRSIEESLGISRAEAEKLKLQLDQGVAPEGEPGLKVRGAVDAALDLLAQLLNGIRGAQRIFMSGGIASARDIAGGLAQRLGSGAQCEPLEATQGAGRSAAILGLRRAVEENGGRLPLVLQVKPTNGPASVARPTPWKWASLAALLAIASLSFPYAEAIFLKARLSRRLAAVKAEKGRLATIDRELNFLQFLKQNEPPYLDALYLLSKSAPPGTRLDSLTMNRRGELSLRGSLGGGTQVVEFRTKLIDSGFFSAVVVEEQTPAPDHRKVTVRMSAQWKSATDRESLAVGPTAAEMEKSKTTATEMSPGTPPPQGRAGPGMLPSTSPPTARLSPSPVRVPSIRTNANP